MVEDEGSQAGPSRPGFPLGPEPRFRGFWEGFSRRRDAPRTGLTEDGERRGRRTPAGAGAHTRPPAAGSGSAVNAPVPPPSPNGA